jgi:hypothetical protein
MGVGAGGAAIISTAATVVGGVISAVGAENQAAAQEKAANYQAQVAANNATIASEQAKQATAAGESNVENQQLQSRQKIGAILAAQAASNVDVNSGSSLDVRTSQQQLGQLDALTIQSNAARQAYGYQTQSVSDTAQSGLYQSQASNDATAGGIKAAGSIISGASSAGNQYARWQQAAGSGGGGGTSSTANPFGSTSSDASQPQFYG